MTKRRKQRIQNNILSWVMIVAGAVIAAFSLEEFLAPNHIFDGGVTGISMIISHALPVKLGILVALLNIPFIVIHLFI